MRRTTRGRTVLTKKKQKRERARSERWAIAVVLVLVVGMAALYFYFSPSVYNASLSKLACEQERELHYIRLTVTNHYSSTVRLMWSYIPSMGWHEEYDVKPNQTATIYTYYAFHVGDNVTVTVQAWNLSEEGVAVNRTADPPVSYNIMLDGDLVTDLNYFPYLVKYAENTATLRLDCRSNQLFNGPHIVLGI